jgi:hypothetical protein
MTTICGRVRSPRAGPARAAAALLLLAAIGFGVLPLPVEPALAPAAEAACSLRSIDVCDGDDAACGVIADLIVLLPETVAVAAAPPLAVATWERAAAPREGFPEKVYRPPRPAC